MSRLHGETWVERVDCPPSQGLRQGVPLAPDILDKAGANAS
jgi:hypothetical protein